MPENCGKPKQYTEEHISEDELEVIASIFPILHRKL
jgi:hypothetical protein